ESDPAQMEVVGVLQQLQHELDQSLSVHRQILRKIRAMGSKRLDPVQGVYLWGDVGRGKTFLMDLFYATLATKRKSRKHFHRMMGEIHTRLKTLKDHEDPLDRVAAEIAKEVSVLCFDEFYVSDIGDAMLLARLLDGLFRRGVTLVATSNVRPADLYATGLQRDRFLPAIALLDKHTRVIQLADGADYRLRRLQDVGTYLTPDDAVAETKLEGFFNDCASSAGIEDPVLDILGRPVVARRCAADVAWFEFAAICDGPRSAQDYVELARRFQTVIVSGVPVFTPVDDDVTRRFISLVDEFYDRRVKLMLSAAAPADRLYSGKKLAFEFRRTTSRLSEMQSAEYLHEAHRG
ncbi:MAG: cell division protein ZapE, partial [Woeseiaceae bacterium]